MITSILFLDFPMNDLKDNEIYSLTQQEGEQFLLILRNLEV